MKKNVNQSPGRRRQWGQILLIAAIVLNVAGLLAGLRISILEDDLAERRLAESYFITNHRNVSEEGEKRVALHIALNQQKMLRRLAGDRLSEKENEVLRSDEAAYQNEIQRSLRKMVVGTYLLANESTSGPDAELILSGLTDEELAKRLPAYQENARQFARREKDLMVRMMDDAAFWKNVHALFLVVSTIVLLVGNLLLFPALPDPASQISIDERRP